MKSPLINYAFIDYQNLHQALKLLGWTKDWSKFRAYLKEEFNIESAYLFIEYNENDVRFYEKLQLAGFICVFTHTIDDTNKGCHEADMTIKIMSLINNFDKAVIITDDKNFKGILGYLISEDKLLSLSFSLP